MLKIADLTDSELGAALRGSGLTLGTGPFSLRIRSPIRGVADSLALLYGAHPLVSEKAFIDFDVGVVPPRGLRRLWRPQVLFRYDDWIPFKPLPAAQAVPMLEWGLNWCISTHAHQYLILHAAVVERAGNALILPAPPGSGKSTLCGALVGDGWRLLSDELGLVALETGECHALARPVNLKNRSIEVLQERLPDAVFSPLYHDTAKGTVGLMAPPAESVRRVQEPARPAWIVSVRYEPGARLQLTPIGSGRTFMHLAELSFNYTLLAEGGFRATSRLVQMTDGYELVYSNLDEALERLRQLDPPHRPSVAAEA